MSHLLPPPLPRIARRALALGVAVSSIATIAAASPAAHRAHHSHAAPAKPKPRRKSESHGGAKRGESSHTTKHSSSTRARRDAAETASLPTLPTLPTLPSTILIPSLDQLFQGGSTSAAQSLATSSAVTEPSTPSGPLSGFSASASRLLSAMIERARSQLGTRYVFGGDDPGRGLDCSAFARFAMEALGIHLPRTAAQQATIGTPVPRDRKLLRPGDLLTFGRGNRVSHVGIYLGEGRFIHASVASGRIIETTIDRNGRLFRRWQGARRLIASSDSSSAAESTF